MSLSAHTMQHLNQLGLLNFVKIDDTGTASAYKLVPVSHWHNGQKFPHDVERELIDAAYSRTTQEGVEYYLVPETTINAKGHVSQYAQVPQEGLGQVRVREAPAPPAVKKYLKAENRKIRRLG